MTSQADVQTRVEALKAEGNAFHVARKYKEAYAKYTDAIEIDGNNAVLYANRAASSLEMEQYLDAASDAQKTTQLDPEYVKGWARWGKASMLLHAYPESIKAWEKAIALCVPADGVKLTNIEQQQKNTCKNGLKAAKDAMDRRQRQVASNIVSANGIAHELPWERAAKLTVDAKSSVWVIFYAHEAFKAGAENLKKITYQDGRLSGSSNVITGLTNGIMRDPRAFIIDSPNWITLYNRQLTMETTVLNAWREEGPKEVQVKAAKMQKEQGWDAARRALTLTVRSWFMRAFMEGNATHDHRSSVQFLGSAISVLEWGLEAWKDVARELRGVIFERTFIRGVKRFYLDSYLAAYKDYGSMGGYTLEELDRLAQALVDDVEAHTLTGNERWHDAGFYPSFFLYPLAEAYAVKGLVKMEEAKSIKSSDLQLSNKLFDESAAFYMKAARTLPLDEEKRLLFYKVAVDAYWLKGAPLAKIMPILSHVRSLAPRVTEIWQYGPFAKDTSLNVTMLRRFEEKAKQQLAHGNLTLDSPSSEIDLIRCY